MAAPAPLWGVFAIEFASEEDGGKLQNHELMMLCSSKAEAEEHADPFDGLTSRIAFYVAPVEKVGGQLRKAERRLA